MTPLTDLSRLRSPPRFPPLLSPLVALSLFTGIFPGSRARSYTAPRVPIPFLLSARPLPISHPVSLSLSREVLYWVIEVKARPRMYLDRHDSREDLSTKINRRHDPVSGFDVLLKRFRVASIFRDESSDGESRDDTFPGWMNFRLASLSRRFKKRALRDVNFFSLHSRSSKRKDIVAAKGRIFTRFPLYISLSSTLAPVQPASTYVPYVGISGVDSTAEIFTCRGDKSILRDHIQTLISFHSFPNAKSIRSVPTLFVG